MHYGRSKRVRADGAWIRIPQVDTTFVSIETGKSISLIAVGRLERVVGLYFPNSDEAELATRLKPWIDTLFIDSKPENGRCLPYDDYLDWKESQ